MTVGADQVLPIVIVGAGLAGLTCAAALRQAGHAPVVLEKSRGLGGRLATRRRQEGAYDHGAVAVSAETAAFSEFLNGAQAAGHAAAWADHGVVGLPGMSGLVAPLAVGVEVRRDCQVQSVSRYRALWRLDAGGREIHAARLALAIPVPQAARLLGDAAPAELAGVEMAPSWTLMVAAMEDRAEIPDDVLSPLSGLARVARQSSKPGRAGPGVRWVVQADASWSEAHLDQDHEVAGRALIAQFLAFTGYTVAEVNWVAHRWRYAQTLRPLGQPCWTAPGAHLWLGGDWCLGGRAEDAYTSGLALAGAILHSESAA
ncbi:MAG: NAD(P)-binding protein [Pseudomonadota bacterium]